MLGNPPLQNVLMSFLKFQTWAVIVDPEATRIIELNIDPSAQKYLSKHSGCLISLKPAHPNNMLSIPENRRQKNAINSKSNEKDL